MERVYDIEGIVITGTTANWNENGTSQIDALERDPYFKVTVDWPYGTTYDDISTDLVGLSGRLEYESSITGFIPSGAIAGDLDMELKTGSKYSAFNTSSPLYGSQRLNRDVAAYGGFTVGGSDQYLQQFTGRTDKVQTSSANRTTSIHATDKSNLLKNLTLQLPILDLARSDYIINAILTEAGIHNGYYNDGWTNELFLFDDTLVGENGATPSTSSGIDYVEGKFGNALNISANGDRVTYLNPTFVRQTAGTIQFWVKMSAEGVGGRMINVTGTGMNDMSIYTSTSGGGVHRIAFTIDDGADDRTLLMTENGITYDEWQHVAVTYDRNMMRIFINGTESAHCARGGLSYAGWKSFVIAPADTAIMAIDHLQISWEARTPNDIKKCYEATTTSNAGVSTFETGKNYPKFAVLDGLNAWETVKKVCDAEGAVFYFDALGVAHFKNRDHLLANLSTDKVTSYDTNTMDLTINESHEQRINKVSVKSYPFRELPGTRVWVSDSDIKIPANGTTVFWANFSSPVIKADTSFTAGTTGTGSIFKAYGILPYGPEFPYWPPEFGPGTYSVWTDASGSVALYGTAYANSMKILATSGVSTGDVYLSWYGTPWVKIWATPLQTPSKDNDTYTISCQAQDSDNIGSYGERSVNINNDFITDKTYAQDMADYLLQYYADPHPVIEGVEIMADPRLELGDVVSLSDSSGATGLDDYFWVTGIGWDAGPPYTQQLKVMYMSTGSFFILDHGTYGKLDENRIS